MKQKRDRVMDMDILTGFEIEKVQLRVRFTAAKLELWERTAEADESAR
ncbi:MAG: hypothetical protein AAF974_04180 [Cyanobacteria bacterium P01_E01_bin.34]